MRDPHVEKIVRAIIRGFEEMRREDGWDFEFPAGNVSRSDTRREDFGAVPRAVVGLVGGPGTVRGHGIERTIRVRVAAYPERPTDDDVMTPEEIASRLGEELLRNVRATLTPLPGPDVEDLGASLESFDLQYPVLFDEADVWDVVTLELAISYAEDFSDPGNVIS